MTGGKKLWAGLAITAFFMVLLLRGIDFGRVAAAFRTVDPVYLLPAVASTLVSYYLRGIRWRALLLPLRKIPLAPVFSATVIGYMINNLLPARVGELARAFLLAERQSLPKGKVLGTLVVDRLLDGLSLLVMLAVVLPALQLPPEMQWVREKLMGAGYAAAAVAAVLSAVVAVVAARPRLAAKAVEKVSPVVPDRYREKAVAAAVSFLSGLFPPGTSSTLPVLLISSLAIWVTAAWPIDLVLRAFGMPLPITGSLFILVLLIFAVMVPASPGYVGTYHAACVYGLMAFRVGREEALGVALVLHALNFLPVTVLGILFLVRDRLSLADVTTKTREKTL